MNQWFVSGNREEAVPIRFFTEKSFQEWLAGAMPFARHWSTSTGYTAAPGSVRLVPKTDGQLGEVWCGISKTGDAFWQAGQLPLTLPENVYQFCFDHLDSPPDERVRQRFALAFGLGSYQFDRYRKPARETARLCLDKGIKDAILPEVEAVTLIRNLVNVPAEDMGPSQLAAEVERVAKRFKAKFHQIIGNDLLKHGFAAVHMVGRASDDPPRLLDLRWGKPSHPKITLVGKGVCFDSGGLDIKPASAMQLMKKDMAGAAHVLGLAELIMTVRLPIRLRVLIPVVENVISGSAYRPGDVIVMRNGKTVEVGNTDAEGRLILADALAEAVTETPDLLIDVSTLTGAARVAVGTELSAFFCDQTDIANALMQAGERESDPLWRLPLYAPYRESMSSLIADMNSVTNDGYAGAIIAGLFLREFVPSAIPWVHIDMMAWNLRSRPGRPTGAEAMSVRALFHYLCQRFLV